MNEDASTNFDAQKASSGSNMSAEEATRVIKEHAAAQKVEIKLTEEQMQAIVQQWNLDPSRPFELSFVIEGRPTASLKVASCAYWGDTCCA